MSLAYLLQTPPIARVPVVRLSTQGYGEIHPTFIMAKFNQLGHKWYIINTSGNCHVLKFNKNYEHPALISGWEELINFHHLPKDVEIDLAYYGDNRFSIMSFKEPTVAEEINSFHSRSLSPNETCHFDIVLDQTSINQTNLTLPSAFADYVKSMDYKWLMICGDNLYQQAVAVINKDNNTRIQIGTWMPICKDLELQVGDTIRFKFAFDDPHKRCHIYKPFPYRT